MRPELEYELEGESEAESLLRQLDDAAAEAEAELPDLLRMGLEGWQSFRNAVEPVREVTRHVTAQRVVGPIARGVAGEIQRRGGAAHLANRAMAGLVSATAPRQPPPLRPRPAQVRAQTHPRPQHTQGRISRPQARAYRNRQQGRRESEAMHERESFDREYEVRDPLREAEYEYAAYRPQRGGQRFPIRHFPSQLRDQGFLSNPHFLQRYLERAQQQGVRIDPRQFGQEFRNAQHYRDTRPGYNSNYAVMGGVPVVYRPGGRQGKQAVLITTLPELPRQAVPLRRPTVQPRPQGRRQRESEALYEWESFDRDYELQYILRAADTWREGESFAGLVSRARAALAAAQSRGTTTQPPVRNFNCNDADAARVQQILGARLTTAQMKARVDAMARTAASTIESAAGALARSPRNARAAQCFREAFGVSPDVVPAWRPSNATWRDLGALIALRLRNAAQILAGGHIGYACLCNPAYPECRECECSDNLHACSSYRGRYNICINRRLWISPPHIASATLLHEALHIYFSREVSHGERGTRSSNASCYEHYVLCYHGRAEARVRTECFTLLPPKIVATPPPLIEPSRRRR